MISQGFCGAGWVFARETMTAFLKAALEDSHPVVRQNAAGALARKLKHWNCGVFGCFAGGCLRLTALS